MTNAAVKLLLTLALVAGAGLTTVAQAGNLLWGSVLDVSTGLYVEAEDNSDDDYDYDEFSGIGDMSLEASVDYARATARAILTSRSMELSTYTEVGDPATDPRAWAGAEYSALDGEFMVDGDGTTSIPLSIQWSSLGSAVPDLAGASTGYYEGYAGYELDIYSRLGQVFAEESYFDTSDDPLRSVRSLELNLQAGVLYTYEIRAWSHIDLHSNYDNLQSDNDLQLTASSNLRIGLDDPTQPVPEPSTLALLGLGLIGTAVAVRRRKGN